MIKEKNMALSFKVNTELVLMVVNTVIHTEYLSTWHGDIDCPIRTIFLTDWSMYG